MEIIRTYFHVMDEDGRWTACMNKKRIAEGKRFDLLLDFIREKKEEGYEVKIRYLWN